MSNVPLSVKNRPKKFTDIVGQEVPVRILTNSFNDDNLHHAYIFDGQFGSGKTTMARILAAMENCDNGPTLEPCGECKNCKDIFAGKSLDVKEIDAASNRGVDDIRAVREEIRYAPMSCRVKYVIIDEAHSLTKIAAEALLKSIEEPPPNVRFILCTTEAQSLKPTIHSRSMVLKFMKISWHEMCEYLMKVAKQENIDFDEDAIKLISKRSKGSVRDALQNLQSVNDFCRPNKISLEDAQEALGAVDSLAYFKLVKYIVNSNVPEAMLIINDLMTKGKSADYIVKGLEEHLRNLLTINACRQNVTGLGFTEDEIKYYAYQGQTAKPIFVSRMMALLIDVQRAISLNLDPQNYLEKFVVDAIIEKVKLAKEEKKGS